MHFLNCYHPVRVVKYGVEHYVPCGQCDYCKHVRNTQMSERLQLEMKHHKYAFFFTLTYSNSFIPKMVYNKSLNCLLVDSDSDLFGTEDSGLFVDCQTLDDNSFNHVQRLCSTLGFFPYLRKSDLQLFTKRFRRNVDYYIIQRLLKHGKIKENQIEKFRIYYSYVGEIGPTNFRPHFHGLMFFDSEILANSFASILRKSWPYGRTHCRISSKTAKDCKYISDYVNQTFRLPAIYSRRGLRPFRLFSKEHPVGLPSISREEIQRIFNECSISVRYEDVKGNQVERPLWSCLEYHIFPRFVAYNQIDRPLRLTLLKDALSYDKFKDYELFHMKYCELPFSSLDDADRYSDPYECYLFNICKGVSLGKIEKRARSSSLYSIFHAARIIQSNMRKFGVSSLSEYLDHIDTYYYKLEMDKLKRQFEFENTWFSHHPDWLQFINLGAYSLDDILTHTSDMRDIVFQINYTIETSHKNRSKHEFEALHPQNSLNKHFNDGSFNGLVNY